MDCEHDWQPLPEEWTCRKCGATTTSESLGEEYVAQLNET